MLTIGKIGGRGGGHWRTADYYTEQVALGAEDYYSGKGEAPGTWTGQGAANLGLTGELQDGELQALFERRHPVSGDQLGRPPGEHAVKGIDLQMAVPKSVSTLWALADEYGQPEVAGKVWDATHGAGRAALDYLERHACTSRAGKGGHIPLEGEGFIGAAFPTTRPASTLHATSRQATTFHANPIVDLRSRTPKRSDPDGPCRSADDISDCHLVQTEQKPKNFGHTSKRKVVMPIAANWGVERGIGWARDIKTVAV